MGEEYARSPCERFPAVGAFSVAPPERLSPPPPAPLPDRFSASPRRVRRSAEAERARRPRYVPPAAHVPVERYVPRPPIPVRPPPPVYCGLACRPPPPAPRKCCGPACREDIAGSPPPSRYVEYVGAAAARRLACTPPPPPPPALQLPCEPQEPPCCVQARRRPQPPHDWHEALFDGTLGRYSGGEAELYLREGAEPIFCRARPVPYALRARVDAELAAMVRSGVLQPVERSDWATPLVIVNKADGGLRLCADFKVTLNKYLLIERYPVPKMEDLFSDLSGNKYFTKLDLSQAYNQVELSEKSKSYTVINTHLGLFKYTRLVYGLSSSPGIFQKLMCDTFKNIKDVVIFYDDILIKSRDLDSHLKSINEVFEVLKSKGWKIKKSKCEFLASEVRYLGYVIDKNGVRVDQNKIKPIVTLPHPNSVTELKSFLGMVNFYGRFIKNLSSHLSPLYVLLKKGKHWTWGKAQKEAFDSIKKLLGEACAVAHFDMSLETVVTVDASSEGLGAVLAQRAPDAAEERVVAYASRALTEPEKHYSQIHKEALAIVFAVDKFHQYLYGRKFTLRTDHKPLVSIFGPNTGIPSAAASRLQRWAVKLSAYDFNIEYIRTDMNAADALSRLIKQHKNEVKTEEQHMPEQTYLHFSTNALLLDYKVLKKETETDPLLSRVLSYIKDGWPNEVDIQQLKPYFNRKNELYTELGCILWGHRVVIPSSCRDRVLSELHDSHMGIVKTKALARSYVWWPQLNDQLEGECRACTVCAAVADAPPAHAPQSWPWPSRPWSRLHIDFLGPMNGVTYMIVVDSCSKWIEAIKMQRTTASSVISVLRDLWARFGLPRQVVSDNGPPFTSTEFQSFLKNNGIEHTFSAPYHPASNGAAESAVKICKRVIKKALKQHTDVTIALCRFLLAYRNTQHATTGESPASILQGRNLRMRLDCLKPDRQARVEKYQRRSESLAGGSQRRLMSGDLVWYRDYSGKDKWLAGTITEVLGTTDYLVKDSFGTEVHRHIDQLKLRVHGANDKIDPIIVSEPLLLPITRESVSSESSSGPGESSPIPASISDRVGSARRVTSSRQSISPTLLRYPRRSSAGLLAPQLTCQSSPGPSASATSLPPPASPPRIVSAPSAPQPPPEQIPQPALEDGVRLRRAHTVAVRDYLKRETQTFFGVQRDNEREQRRLWYERRRRHAARALGDLRPDLPPDHHPDDDDISMYGASGAAPREARGQTRERPDVLPAPASLEPPSAVPPRPGKDSVARLTLTGLSYVVTAVTRRSRQSTSAQWSRSFRSGAPSPHDDADVDDVFFAPQALTSPLNQQHHDDADTVDGTKGARSPLGSSGVEYRRPERSVQWGAGGIRIHTPMLEPLADNSNRRQFGMGVVGRFFRRSLRKSVTHQEEVARQLDELTDYRPYFTWWVSTVQTLVLFLSLLCYGFGPVGFGRHTHSSQVLVKSLSLQQVEWEEPASFWLGPRAADLIHLGAKFAPCMRRDARIARAIAASARRERDTACCIRNDDSGCVQSSKADCSNTISTWKKWSSGESGPGGRISGSVCGLDPKFCEAPRSIAPHEWPDDITKWPICRKSVLDGSAAAGRAGHAAEHMACEVIGHPCCIGVHGQCVITTKEHCDFVKGYFHEEASLCSQVSCLDDVCGMLPFMRRRRPDQLYRAWTSLFVHAGLLHLAASLALQWLFMRDLEKMAGPVRMASIYLGSGVAGNMASSIFEPYRAEVGPAGSHFGLLACLIVEVIGAWPLLRHPRRALLKLVGIAIALFLLGLLPWIDNFAHVFGFVFGFLLAYALLPFITFGLYERRRKIVLVWVCLISAAAMLCALIALFYAAPAYECTACAYFTCLPFAPDMCASQDVRVRQLDGV